MRSLKVVLAVLAAAVSVSVGSRAMAQVTPAPPANPATPAAPAVPAVPRTPREPGSTPWPRVTPTPTPRNVLPRTGSNPAPFAASGTALVALGLAMAHLRRRSTLALPAVVESPHDDYQYFGW